jgi:hypothetical protein
VVPGVVTNTTIDLFYLLLWAFKQLEKVMAVKE